MMDTEPVMTLPMYVPSAFAPEPLPLPFATYSVRPSAEAATALGYHPAGMRPAKRIPLAPRRTTATALLPAMATYSVRPSGDRASALGSLPGGASGASATVSCSRTWPVTRSTRATPFAPASATSSSDPRRARAEGWGPTKRADRRTGGLTDRSITVTVESPQLLTYSELLSPTAV